MKRARKRSLVTGGAGFLGSHLCRRLLEDGADVICVDNFFTGSRENIVHLLGHPHFEVMRHDVTFPLYVEVDEIYNLACPASPIHYQHNPVQTVKTSVLGADQHAGPRQAAGRENLPGLDIRSLWRSGGASAAGRVPRQRQPDRHRVPATTRASAARRRCSSTTTGRTTSTSGWRASSTPTGHACSRTTAAWSPTSSCRRCAGEPITLYGDGSQTRSFCYVDDLIEGIVRLMDAPDDVIGPINLGNPGEFSIRELAEQVVRLTGADAGFVLRPLPSDDPLQRCPDISRARQLLGWQPKVPLALGLRRTIDYFAGQLGVVTPLRAEPAVYGAAMEGR